LTPNSGLSTHNLTDLAIRSLPFGVIVTDREGRVVAASRAAQSVLGTRAFEGMFYEELPILEELKRPEMAEPALLAAAPAADVWPVRTQNGDIVGALQLLADADASIGGIKLCAAMAHELRNPLTGIQGLAGLLQRVLEHDDSCRDLVGKIISGVHVVNATVSNMLDFCRPKALHTKHVDLQGLIRSALDTAACSDGFNVEVDVGRCEGICCDRLQMLQALINLIRNAAEAMPEGGKLTFSARRRGGAVRLTVADTGCGMDAHTRANIFRPFFSTKSRGTGMGLAIVRKIIQQHNGDIEIESEPGKGTRVTLILPQA